MGLPNTPPDFIQSTQDAVLASFIQYYEQCYFEQTGQTIELHPAQAEQLLANSSAYMGWLSLLKIQFAATMNIARFATYPVLDYISEPWGVIRLASQASKCTILFTLVAGHADLVIPAGTRIQSQDGLSTFATQADIPVKAGVNSITAICVCDTTGVAADGYIAGKIAVILDPQAYLTSATNTDTTVGGSDIESDAAMYQRLIVSNAAFSTCGADDGYIYYAKSASPLILDVYPDNGVIDGEPTGKVKLYVLVAGGATPDEILADVEAACRPKDKRPTSDVVSAVSPAIVDYSVSYDVIAYTSVADTTALVQASKAAVQALVDNNSQKLGIDVIVSEIIAAAKIDGVADIIMHSPSTNTALDKTQASFCTSVTASLTGLNDDK